MAFHFNPLFYREHLGAKSDHKELIQTFEATQPEGDGLRKYLQKHAFIDESTGNIRTYLIRQRGTGELVGYYSIRAGDILLMRDDWTSAISGVELTNFAVNGAYRKKHPKITILGRRIFFDFILPQVRQLHETLGTSILYIYALDEEPLKKYYKTLGFSNLPEEDEKFVHSRCKPSYDGTCICMYMLL